MRQHLGAFATSTMSEPTPHLAARSLAARSARRCGRGDEGSLPGLAPSVVAQHKVVTRAREGMTMPAVRPVFWAETLLPEQWSDTPSGHRRC
jgi:hypothetical protein